MTDGSRMLDPGGQPLPPAIRWIAHQHSDRGAFARLADQISRMVCHMVRHEGLDEPVAVIVAFLSPQHEILTGCSRGALEGGGMQLPIQKLVGRPLIDQYS